VGGSFSRGCTPQDASITIPLSNNNSFRVDTLRDHSSDLSGHKARPLARRGGSGKLEPRGLVTPFAIDRRSASGWSKGVPEIFGPRKSKTESQNGRKIGVWYGLIISDIILVVRLRLEKGR